VLGRNRELGKRESSARSLDDRQPRTSKTLSEGAEAISAEADVRFV